MLIIVSKNNASKVIEEMERGSRYKLCEEIEGYKNDNVGLMFYEVEENKEMKKTFSITRKGLDTRKLNNKIDQFKIEEGYDPYIFMNEETLDEFTNGEGILAKYCGYSVFRDDTKKFGEVELR